MGLAQALEVLVRFCVGSVLGDLAVINVHAVGVHQVHADTLGAIDLRGRAGGVVARRLSRGGHGSSPHSQSGGRLSAGLFEHGRGPDGLCRGRMNAFDAITMANME